MKIRLPRSHDGDLPNGSFCLWDCGVPHVYKNYDAGSMIVELWLTLMVWRTLMTASRLRTSIKVAEEQLRKTTWRQQQADFFTFRKTFRLFGDED